MSADDALSVRIARIDTLRSRLGLLALVCALAAVAMAAMGLAAAGGTRLIAFGLLGVGGVCVVARLRLAWMRVSLARERAQRTASAGDTP